MFTAEVLHLITQDPSLFRGKIIDHIYIEETSGPSYGIAFVLDGAGEKAFGFRLIRACAEFIDLDDFTNELWFSNKLHFTPIHRS